VEKEGLPSAMLNQLMRLAAQNPEFYRSQAMRLSTFGKPRVITARKNFPVISGCRVGVEVEVPNLMASGLNWRMKVFRDAAGGCFSWRVAARSGQGGGGAFRHDTGVLSANGLRKDRGCRLDGAARKTNTLILVHRRQLLDQWRASFDFLEPPLKVSDKSAQGAEADWHD
jgi:hypothetical protein